jgi:hypothetical protein
MRDVVEEAVDAVEALCAPDQMTKGEALEFLEEVIGRLRSSIEALRDEIENEAEEEDES